MRPKPYFSIAARASALDAEARSWLGTPFLAGNCVRGRAVDCVRYAAAIMRAAGAFPALTLPDYALDHAKHTTHSQLLHYLLDEPALAGRLTFAPVHGPRLPGDLYGLRSGHADHHIAVHLPWDQVTHAVETHGVIIHEAGEEDFRKRILYVMRPLDVEDMNSNAAAARHPRFSI